MSASEAISGWREIVGEEHIASGAALADLEANVSAFPARTVVAVVRPGDPGEVEEIVRIARAHRVPLYPISTGRNWGLGSRQPVQDGCAIVDLSRLNRIREVDESARYAIVEPGVTQAQLAAHLEKHAPTTALNVTGSSPNSSVLGNLLERGTGFRRHRTEEVRGLEVVLGTGQLMRTGLWAGDGPRQLHHYRTGLGPNLDALFTQSNLGIVTAAVVDLVPRRDDLRMLMLSFPDHHLADVVDGVRKLFVQGTLRSLVHIFNDKRILAMTNSHEVTTWTGLVAVDGTSAQVDLAVAEARSVLESGKGAEVTVVDQAMATGANADPLISGLFSVHSGKPSTAFLEGMFRSVPGMEPPEDLDDADNTALGYLACMPVVAVEGRTARELVDLVEEICAAHDIFPAVAVNPTGADYAEVVVNLYFDRTDAAETAAAHSCNRELHRRLYENGFRFYRVDIENMPYLTDVDSGPWAAVQLIKSAFDPDHILAPGRYCPS